MSARRRYVWLCGCVGERVARLIPFAAPPGATNSAGVVAQAVASVSWPNPNDYSGSMRFALGSITPGRTTIVRLLGPVIAATGMARFLYRSHSSDPSAQGTTAGSGEGLDFNHNSPAWVQAGAMSAVGAGPTKIGAHRLRRAGQKTAALTAPVAHAVASANPPASVRHTDRMANSADCR